MNTADFPAGQAVRRRNDGAIGCVELLSQRLPARKQRGLTPIGARHGSRRFPFDVSPPADRQAIARLRVSKRMAGRTKPRRTASRGEAADSGAPLHPEGVDAQGMIIVKFAPTGAVRQSPWGPSVDTKGDIGHYHPKFANQIIDKL